MNITELRLKGSFIIKPKLYKDNRGVFFESFNKSNFFFKTGIEIDFVQTNQSISSQGVLRGLHFQKGKYAQAKLVRVVKGKVLDVIVDIRPESQTFGEYLAFELSAENNTQIFMPRGFAHGFLALEEGTIFSYKCDNYYNQDSESGIRFDDQQLNIQWNYPLNQLVLSEKDQLLPFLKDLY